MTTEATASLLEATRDQLAKVLRQLEAELGAQGAFPITRHLAAAWDEIRCLERRREREADRG